MQLRDLPLQLAHLALERQLGLRIGFRLDRHAVALGRSTFGGTRAQHLIVARPIPIHSDAFALGIVRHLVNRAHIVNRCGEREVGGLGDGRIAVLLKRRLHADMKVRRDVVRRVEHCLPLGRHFGMLRRTRRRDALHQFRAVPSFLLRDGHEIFVDIGHAHAGLIAHKCDGKQRLKPAGTAGDDGNGARRRDGGGVAIAEHLHGANAQAIFVAGARVVRTPDRLRPFGERATLAGQALTFALALDVDELHELAPHLHAFSTIVWNAHAHQHIGKAHHA